MRKKRETERGAVALPPYRSLLRMEKGETRIPLSPYRHFERSEKSSLHTGNAETVG